MEQALVSSSHFSSLADVSRCSSSIRHLGLPQEIGQDDRYRSDEHMN